MTALAEHVAARWLTNRVGEGDGHGSDPSLADDLPTVVRDVWIERAHDAEHLVWRPDPILSYGWRAILPDTRGRYRVTCDDGVRRRLTLQQLRGEA